MSKEKRITRSDLDELRSELSIELALMTPSQRKEYLKAAGEVYDALAKMAKLRPIKNQTVGA